MIPSWRGKPAERCVLAEGHPHANNRRRPFPSQAKSSSEMVPSSWLCKWSVGASACGWSWRDRGESSAALCSDLARFAHWIQVEGGVAGHGRGPTTSEREPASNSVRGDWSAESCHGPPSAESICARRHIAQSVESVTAGLSSAVRSTKRVSRLGSAGDNHDHPAPSERDIGHRAFNRPWRSTATQRMSVKNVDGKHTATSVGLPGPTSTLTARASACRRLVRKVTAVQSTPKMM